MDDGAEAKELCGDWVDALNAALYSLRVWDPKRAESK